MSKVKSHRKKSAPAGRKDPAKGSVKKERLPAHKVPGGSRRGITDAGAQGDAVAPLLNPGFKSMSRFQLGDNCLVPQTNNTHALDLVDGLPILHACLKQHPDFNDNRDWRTVPPASKVADYLVSKTRGLRPAKFTWTFDRDHKGDPRLVYYRKLNINVDGINLEFLPMLEKQNPRIHEVALDVLNLVATSWRLQVISHEFSDNLFADPLTQINTMEEEEYKTGKWDVEKYLRGGIAYNYRQLIGKNRGVTLATVQKKLKCMPYGHTQPTQAISYWLRSAVESIKCARDIRDYHTPSLLEVQSVEDAFPTRPQDECAFLWSERDTVGGWIIETLRATHSSVGSAPPVSKYELYPKRKMVYVPPEPIKVLGKWLFNGNRYYRWYYSKRLRDQRIRDLRALGIKQKDQHRSQYLVDIL